MEDSANKEQQAPKQAPKQAVKKPAKPEPTEQAVLRPHSRGTRTAGVPRR